MKERHITQLHDKINKLEDQLFEAKQYNYDITIQLKEITLKYQQAKDKLADAMNSTRVYQDLAPEVTDFVPEVVQQESTKPFLQNIDI